MAMPTAATAMNDHADPAAAAAHCADTKAQPEDESVPEADCVIDCAVTCSAIPAIAAGLSAQPMAAATVQPFPLLDRISGLHPESDPPPPRIA
jgi:hypothetical protein